MTNKRVISLNCGFLLLLLILSFAVPSTARSETNASSSLSYGSSTVYTSGTSTASTTIFGISSTSTIIDINVINSPEIVAKNAVVYDVQNKRFVYAKNAEQIVPMASLVKIITATVFLQLNSGRYKSGNQIQTVQIVKKDKGYNAGDRDLVDGEVWKVENIIRYMLITSSNYAAQSLVGSLIDDDFAFSLLMNKTVKDLGYKSFSFQNSSGLSTPNPYYNPKRPDELNVPKQIPSAIGSAKEIAILFNSIFTAIPFLGTASIIPEATFINLSGNTHVTKNVNYSIFQIPHIVAGKTGTTEESGGNLVIEVNPNNKKYVIVILGSTIEDRYNDALKLASSTEAFATLK
jgi:D-alanyl-D-alanine carboxypeptidase (penicillin-binding protein 5/6)